MAGYEQKNKLHAEVMSLWDNYKAQHKSLLALQAEVDDLDNKIRDCGKRIYELYKKSDGGLDGDFSGELKT